MTQKNNPYLFLLITSLLMFMGKGVLYATIGSYLPLFLAILILLAFFMFKHKAKAFSLINKIWALIIIIWAIIRIVIGGFNYFVKALTENHLHQQLGIQGTIISITFLWIGVILFKTSNKML